MAYLSTGRRVVVGLIAAVLILILALGVRAYLREQATIRQVEALRDQVVDARARVDACLVERDRAEVIFQQADQAVDSLRTAVEAVEIDLPEGGRGVDAERYPAYLTTVEAYNRAVVDWEAAADVLREVDARCREVVESHNLLADSLTRFLASEGVELPGS